MISCSRSLLPLPAPRPPISVLDSMALLGPDMSRARLRHALSVVVGPVELGKKRLKKLEKDYQQILVAIAAEAAAVTTAE